ncbi:hypothetical protein ACGFX8_37780 [Streptomyces sp. NPDC048362]|uniref:hypothetical protein n=1 Tax=Streptomyces sp. NPDC048362 TaxID=3365539 RepID=UPI003723787B
MTAEDRSQHPAGQLPIVTATDGHAYLGVDAVVALIRALAASCRELADDPDFDLCSVASALDLEADHLDCLAIQHTHVGGA